MLNMDGAKGIQPVPYFHTEKWDRKLKVERKETKDDGDQSDAKNRQKNSYEEILFQLLEAIRNAEYRDFNMEV
jgi:hypothetical protein